MKRLITFALLIFFLAVPVKSNNYTFDVTLPIVPLDSDNPGLNKSGAIVLGTELPNVCTIELLEQITISEYHALGDIVSNLLAGLLRQRFEKRHCLFTIYDAESLAHYNLLRRCKDTITFQKRKAKWQVFFKLLSKVARKVQEMACRCTFLFETFQKYKGVSATALLTFFALF